MPILLAAPSAEPVTLAEAKAWLRLDGDADDALVAALIVAARKSLEAMTRRLFVTQGWRVTLDAWPADGQVRLPFAPLQSVSAIRVYDVNDAAATLSPSQWRVRGAADDPAVAVIGPCPTPGRAFAGVEIDAVYGYGGAADAPEPLRQAMLMLVAAWFECRGDGETLAIPAAARVLIAPCVRLRLA